jgi:hypothetical protein
MAKKVVVVKGNPFANKGKGKKDDMEKDDKKKKGGKKGFALFTKKK